MGIESMEYARLLWGIMMMILSGYLWSLLIFKKMKVQERIVFGFGFTLAVSACIVMLFSIWMRVTGSFFALLFVVYMAIPIPFLAMKKKSFSFALPERKKIMKGIILAGILIFVFYMTFLPHSVREYDLPFHADEWVHWGYIRGFMDSGEIKFPNPFTGGEWMVDPEIGFHVFLACFKWLSGAELKAIFLFMPSLLAVFTSLTAFSLGERSERKFGLGAAFLVAFIPTSNRFLGPSFLVPLSLGLFLTLLSLLIAQMKSYRKYPLLFFMVLFTAVAHPPSAVAMAIALLCYAILLPIEKNYREGAFIALAVIAPFLISYLVIPKSYFEMGISSLFGEKYTSTLSMVDINSYMGHLGYIVLALFFFASFMAIYKGKALHRGMFLAALSFISIIFLYDNYNFGLSIMYDRSFSYLFLFITILAGYGLAGIREYGEKGINYAIKSKKFFHGKISAKRVSIAIVILLCLTNAFFAVPQHKEEPYYKVISEKEFNAFDWIRNNIDGYRDEHHSFDRAAVPPLKAPAFSAVTGVHTICSNFLPKYGMNIEKEMKSFLAGKGKDIDFLEKYDIGLVYKNCENENLLEIHENMYLYYGLPPTANFTFTPRNESVTFISTSTTPYGKIINWTWDFGDGDISNGKIHGLKFEEGDYAKTKMKMNGSFSIEMWIQPDFSYNDGEIHEWFLWYGGGTYINCFKHSNNRVYFVVRGEKWKAAHPVIEFDANTWHHFAGIYDKTGRFTLYWDGKFIEFATGGGKISSEEGSIIIGGRNNRWFNGCIRDVRIYGRTLNNSEVEGNYNGNVVTNGLVSWWKFDEGKGNIAYGRIGGQDATIYGARWVNYAEYTYGKAGEYEVTLTVRNEDGLSDSISKKIFVSSS
ncbi:MAG: LamG-like jellyroll fold domain-containing protein [Candidatus Thermoplasmatota archaeon]|nr:LamG-like jellyroll fold domain-containing protein [Candidatus Thermoplasmatota archaeon]